MKMITNKTMKGLSLPISVCDATPNQKLTTSIVPTEQHSKQIAIDSVTSSQEDQSWAEKAWKALIFAMSARSSHADLDSDDQRTSFVQRYAKRSEEGTAIKWLKYHISYIFAYALNQKEEELPAAPFALEGELPGRFSGGKVGRFLQTIMARGRAGSWTARRVAYDILMSKLGMPPAKQAFVDKSLQDHRSALSKPQRCPNSEEFPVLLQVQEEIDHICKMVFKGKICHHSDPIPSLNACYEQGFADTGSFGHLVGAFLGLDSKGYIVPTLVGHGFGRVNVLISMAWSPRGGLEVLHLPDVDDLTEDFQSFVDCLWRSRLNERLDATPIPILEPLKVRIITKGGAPEYYRALEFQKLMHGNLKQWPVFEYMGHPIDDKSWADCFGNEGEIKDDEFYVSGDYKAATDNLNPILSEYTWKCIAKYAKIMSGGKLVPLLNTDYYLLGKKCLTFHRLHYGKTDFVDQSWGQLMGSPMSFPILCIVNAAATCVALGTSFTKETRMKVNGDDIAFVSNPEQYAYWKKVTKICGLEFSLGKNYTSREFLIMNSELRRVTRPGTVEELVGGFVSTPGQDQIPEGAEEATVCKHKAPWQLEGFANQAVINHTIKKGMEAGRNKLVVWTELESLSNELLRGIPDRHQWELMKRFLHNHQWTISEMPSMCNLWIPKPLGGAGVCIPATKTMEELISGSNTRPELLLAERKQAAVLACDSVLRSKRATCPSNAITGRVGECMGEIKSLINQQIRPTLRNKPLHREQHTLPGGKTLLGLLILGLEGDEGTWGLQLSEDRVGPLQEVVPFNTIIERNSDGTLGGKLARPSLVLKKKYSKWLGGKSNTSLSPMSFEKMESFQEHLSCFSYIEIMKERSTGRLDQLTCQGDSCSNLTNRGLDAVY